MTQITIRGMKPEVEQKVRDMAKKSGYSLNRVILNMIYQHTGLKKRDTKPQADSLKKLAGGWSQKDASRFMQSIKSCSQIDEEMWM